MCIAESAGAAKNYRESCNNGLRLNEYGPREKTCVYVSRTWQRWRTIAIRVFEGYVDGMVAEQDTVSGCWRQRV